MWFNTGPPQVFVLSAECVPEVLVDLACSSLLMRGCLSRDKDSRRNITGLQLSVPDALILGEEERVGHNIR